MMILLYDDRAQIGINGLICWLVGTRVLTLNERNLFKYISMAVACQHHTCVQKDVKGWDLISELVKQRPHLGK